MRRFLLLLLPYFRAERVDLEARDLGLTAEPRPLALVVSQGSAVRVADRNAEAKNAGIEVGMTLAEARARLPSLQAAPLDPAGDDRALHWIADWAVRFGPAVHRLPPNAVAVEIGGSAHLFGGERSMAEKATDMLAERGFRVSAAIAATVGAAYALAVSQDPAGLGKTKCVTVVPRGEELNALRPIPVRALRLDECDVTRLDSLGVRTISELLALPRADLRARFGEALPRRLAEALGEVEEAVPLHSPAGRFRAEVAFPEPIEGGEMLIYGLRRVLEQAADWLLARLEGARRLALEIAGEGGLLVLEVGLAAPAREGKRLLALCRLALERARGAGRVTALCVEILDAVPLPFAQKCLASGGSTNPDAGKRAIDGIGARLGEHAVWRAELVDDHRPERAFRLRTATRRGSGEARRSLRTSRAASSPSVAISRGRPPPPRPTRLFRSPRPLEVVSDVEGRPSHVRPKIGLVRAVRGPERLAGTWWASRRGKALGTGTDDRGNERGTRDYYEIEAADGFRFWIFFERGRDRWFLHGIF